MPVGAVWTGEWGLPNVFVRTGLAQAALAPLYRASDVFVLPSSGEGLPLVLLEAIACGLASVASAETAAADHRLAGLLYPVALDPGNTLANAAATLQAVRASLARIPGEPLQRRFECMRAWYSWSSAARHYASRFLGVIQDTPCPGTLSPGGRQWAPDHEPLRLEQARRRSPRPLDADWLCSGSQDRHRLRARVSCAQGWRGTRFRLRFEAL